MADKWHNSYSKIKVFGKILYKAEILTDIDEVFEYFDRPSIYDEAFQLWESLGYPEPGEKGWDGFVDNIQVQVVEEEEDDAE